MSDAEFEAFCSKELVRQRGLGCCVPDVDNTADYNLWRLTAREVFNAQQQDLQSKSGKKLKQNPKQTTLSDSDSRKKRDEPLVHEIAAQIEQYLDNQFFPSATAHVVDTRQEEFPLPTQEEDMRGLLSTLEVSLRLGLTCLDNHAVYHVALSGVQNHTTLMNKGIVAFHRGKFPSIYLLLNLLSVSAVFQKWEMTNAADRRKIIDSAIAVCHFIKSPQSEALVTVLQNFSNTKDTSALLQHISELVSCIPYDFPAVCRPALCAVCLDRYTEPAGVLLLATPSTPARKRRRNPEEEQEEESQDVSVGELVGHPKANDPLAPPPLLLTEHVCHSKYHRRYAIKEATASRRCIFCTTCHMMEVLFNGYEKNCSWNHWPSVHKVKYHLKFFPEVRRQAMEQLELLAKGERLKRIDTIPL